MKNIENFTHSPKENVEIVLFFDDSLSVFQFESLPNDGVLVLVENQMKNNEQMFPSREKTKRKMCG